VISEKAMRLGDRYNQVVFRTAPDAGKAEVREAVESFFNVQVQSVQILNQKGKARTSGRFPGCRKGTRKAYVCLKPGQEINFEAESK